MHVTVHRIPPAGLVVQVVDRHAPICRGCRTLLTREVTQLPAHVGPSATLVPVAALPVMLQPSEFVQPPTPSGYTPFPQLRPLSTLCWLGYVEVWETAGGPSFATQPSTGTVPMEIAPMAWLLVTKCVEFARGADAGVGLILEIPVRRPRRMPPVRPFRPNRHKQITAPGISCKSYRSPAGSFARMLRSAQSSCS